MPLPNKTKLLLQQYIYDNYIDEFISSSKLEEHFEVVEAESMMQEDTRSLEDVLGQVHETFSEMLIRKI